MPARSDHIQTFDGDKLGARLAEINRRMYEELREHLVVNSPDHRPNRGKTLVPARKGNPKT